MDTRERHIEENERRDHRDEAPNADLIAESLTARGKNNKRKSTVRINKLWLWFGVLVLIFILLFWLFAIGTFGDLADWFNG